VAPNRCRPDESGEPQPKLLERRMPEQLLNLAMICKPQRQRLAMRSSIIAALGGLLLVAPMRAQAHRNGQEAAGVELENMARAEFGNLSQAEINMLHLAPTRDVAWASPSHDINSPLNDPANAATWGPERTVRAALVEWLLSDPAAAPKVHPSGLAVKGAAIKGLLDLSYLRIGTPLMLVMCAIPDGIDLRYANYQSLDLRLSRVGSINGDQSIATGDVLLRYGHYGDVSFYRAEIGGNLELNGGQFVGEEPLSAVDATIRGDALFHEDFTTSGIVDFRLARIGRSLSFNQAHFIGKGDNGLDAGRVTISGTLYWVDVTTTPRTELLLSDAHASAVWDNEKSWPAVGNLALDGFVYNGFDGGPQDAEARLRWLALQPPALLSQPQPYRQLAEVLRASGRPEGATQVEIARENMITNSGRIGFGERLWRCALDAVIGYGYRPLRAIWWILGFVAFGAALFRWGYEQRLITPTEADAYEAFLQRGEPPPYYPPFSSIVYSLENFLPVVELHQGQYWRPNPRHRPRRSRRITRFGDGTLAPRLLRVYLWIHILAGWTITPLLFAGLAGLLRS